jgi:hypothetical protein
MYKLQENFFLLVSLTSVLISIFFFVIWDGGVLEYFVALKGTIN